MADKVSRTLGAGSGHVEEQLFYRCSDLGSSQLIVYVAWQSHVESLVSGEYSFRTGAVPSGPLATSLLWTVERVSVQLKSPTGVLKISKVLNGPSRRSTVT